MISLEKNAVLVGTSFRKKTVNMLYDQVPKQDWMYITMSLTSFTVDEMKRPILQAAKQIGYDQNR